MRIHLLMMSGVIALAAATIGCDATWRDPWSSSQPEVEDTRETAEGREIIRLKERAATLKNQLDQYRFDNKQLTKEKHDLTYDIDQLRWMNQEQGRSLKDLGGAVRERDENIAIAAELRDENALLKEKLADLQAAIDALKQRLTLEPPPPAPDVPTATTVPAKPIRPVETQPARPVETQPAP